MRACLPCAGHGPLLRLFDRWHWFRLMSDARSTSNFSGRRGGRESCSSSERHAYCQGETMTLTHIRCPYCNGKNVEEQSTYTIKCGAPRTLYYCSSCERSFSETRNTPIAQLKTPIALVVQVLAALTEGVGINAATRLYGVSKNSIYRWQERLSGLKKRCCCLL
jgi:transposase-like protein